MRYLSWMRGPVRDEETGEGAGGGGAGTPPVFDPAKFQLALMAEVNKTLNGFAKTLKTTLTAKTETPPPATTETETETETPPPGQKAKKSPEMIQAERDMANLRAQIEAGKAETQKAKDEAKKEKRDTAISKALSEAGIDPKYSTAAFRVLSPDIDYNEDGVLVAPDGSGLNDYVKNAWLKDNENFLPARKAGGAGATKGDTRSTRTAVDFDSIKPGMSAADLQAARMEIARVARETLAGKITN